MLNSSTFSHFGFRSFVPLRSARTFSGPSRSHWNHIDGAPTLPRTKSKTYSSPSWSATPSISVAPAPKPVCPSTLSGGRPKPSDSLHLPVSEPTDPPPPPDPPPPCVSSTLPVPTLRLSPSPTSLCQGANLDGSGARQPSPVARERRAKSISILTTNIQPLSANERSVNKEERDVLRSGTDGAHSSPEGYCSVTYTESHRQAAETRSSFVLSENVDSIKDERSDADRSKTPPRKTGIPAIRQPRQLEFLPNAATGTPASGPEGITLTDVPRKSRLALDARPIHSGVNLDRKHRTAQTAGFGSKEPLRRNADLPASPLGSDSTEVFWNQSSVVPKLRQFSFNTKGKTDAAHPSASNLSRLRGNANTQMNVGSALNLSSGSIKDYSEACQESCLSASDLCLRGPDPQQTVVPAKCSTSQAKCSKSHTAPHNQSLHSWRNKSHATVNVSDARPNQTAEGPAELPERSPQSRVENRPLSVGQRPRKSNGFGYASNGVFDFLVQPQQRAYQRAGGTTPMAWPALNQTNYPRPEKAVFLEEDPYYVTMYHPGSVYVGE